MNHFTKIFCLSVLVTVMSECGPGQSYRKTSRRRRLRAKYICADCLRGKYMPIDLHEIWDCYNCPSGKWGAHDAATKCEGTGVCIPGQYGKIGAKSADQVIPCKTCNPGQYQPASGQGECLNCPGGKFSNTTGSVTCFGESCSPGRYGVVRATSPNGCLICPVDTFTNNPGATECYSCPYGKYGLTPGMTSCLDIENCGSFRYFIKQTRECQLCNPYIEILGSIAWTLFALTIIAVCCKPDKLWIVTLVANFAIAVMATTCRHKLQNQDTLIITSVSVFTLSVLLAIYILAKRKPASR